MKSFIVGTAGHIDHGKTALVKALTGIDADRLEEEKERGITIDLGFAHLDLPGLNGERLRLGFIDVPGHERFVRNMLAGVGGVDLVLLVIAANESIMPQTQEHFDILQFLNVQRGITVLTKADTIDAETLDVVRLEVGDFLRGTFLESPKSPIIAVSSLTGAGVNELKYAIVEATGNVKPRDALALTRLPIDRVFTMKGFGTVVTGTLISGTIRKEDELEIFPGGKRVRVRGVQVYGQAADEATAGQRTALNLANATKDELSRGMILAQPGKFAMTRRADVQLKLLPSVQRPLKNRTRLRFHSYAMETIVQVELHVANEVNPGEAAFAQLFFAKPILLLPGDHFILRQPSPLVTIGGGVVLDATPMLSPKEVKKTQAMSEPLLEAFTHFEQRSAILTRRVTRRGKRGLSLPEAVAETGWRQDEIVKIAEELTAQAVLVRVQDRTFVEYELKSARQNLLDTLAAFHKKDPLLSGMPRGELQDEMVRVFVMAKELFEAVLSAMVREKKLELVGDLVRLPGHGAVMKDEEAESKKKIEEVFDAAGLKVPALHEVLAGLKIDRARSQKIMTMLLRDKVLVKISDELVFHRGALEELRRVILAEKTKTPKIDVAKFKDLTGVSRKYAIPLLEYLDRERVTRRVGDTREIL